MEGRTTFSAMGPRERIDALVDPGSFAPLPGIDSAVLAGPACVGGEPAVLAAFDAADAGGSIGRREAERLMEACELCQRESWPLLLVIDSAGARLTEGLQALGAFRRLYRRVLEFAARGGRLLALLPRHAFGGASMLAFACERRIYSERTLLAMSGPAIIEALGGRDQLNARDRNAVRDLMGGKSRCRHGEEEHLVADSADAFRAAALRWLGEIEERGPPSLAQRHADLKARLSAFGLEPVPPCPADPVPRALGRTLDALFPRGCRAGFREGVLWGTAATEAGPVGVLGLLGGEPVGARRAWLLGEGALAFGHAHPKLPLVLLMDAPGHAARSADERVILSAYLTHLAQVLHHVKGLCPLTLLVTGAAAGGIYVSLACPADRVWALPHASIMELPPQAVAQVLGAAEEEDRGPERLLELGVVDRVLPADEFARAGRALFDRSLP